MDTPNVLTLSDLALLSPPHMLDPARLAAPPRQWTGYFQSPVDKAAWTLDGSFALTPAGTLQNASAAFDALCSWLNLKPGAARSDGLERWLKTGTPPRPEILRGISSALRRMALSIEYLYNQPICRLVRSDQLRYDPVYHVIYQMTPGQLRLFETQREQITELTAADLDRLRLNRLNQRVYWALSELFQSLVAMFDSDLGRFEADPAETSHPPDSPGPPSRITKELVRIHTRGADAIRLAPAELSSFSPLRFWSPPPTFARCVFHMLFWRPLLTGLDLYNRPILRDTVAGRSDYYYVIVNTFNAAKYRIANYADLFEAVSVLSAKLSNRSPEAELSKLPDIRLSDDDRSGMFYPSYTKHSGIEPLRKQRVSLAMALSGAHPAQSTVWDLARPYQGTPGEATKVTHLQQFLRDKALELILWSHYQMELRSIGTIPVQNLYRISLSPHLQTRIEQLAREWDNDNESSRVRAKINEEISALVAAPQTNSDISLTKVYGGVDRDLFDRDHFDGARIRWFPARGRET